MERLGLQGPKVLEGFRLQWLSQRHRRCVLRLCHTLFSWWLLALEDLRELLCPLSQSYHRSVQRPCHILFSWRLPRLGGLQVLL